jgi:hypothetical protein
VLLIAVGVLETQPPARDLDEPATPTPGVSYGRTGRISQLPGKPAATYAPASYPGRARDTRPLRRPRAVPASYTGEDPPPCVTFGIDARGLSSRCLRFVPPLPVTTQDSLAAGGHLCGVGFAPTRFLCGFPAADVSGAPRTQLCWRDVGVTPKPPVLFESSELANQIMNNEDVTPPPYDNDLLGLEVCSSILLSVLNL